MLEPTNELPDLLELPDSKMTTEQVLELTKTYLGCGEFDWKQGRALPDITSGPEVRKIFKIWTDQKADFLLF